MSVRIEGSVIYLEGLCPVEDAEPLLIALQDDCRRSVNLAQMARAHMAVAQVLAVARPQFVGSPEADFVINMLLPALLVEDKPQRDTRPE